MADGAARRRPLRVSVFAKLLAIMLVMAASLLVMVSFFFWTIAVPVVHGALGRMIDDQAQLVADTTPDLAAARELSDRLDMEIRYGGPGGAWATDPALPTIAEARQARRVRYGNTWRSYRLVAAPQGGQYLLAWTFAGSLYRAHQQILVLLLLVMAVVVVVAWAVLRQLLVPLRWLGEGVARLAAGDLEVAVPVRSRDELGAVTAAFNQMVRRVREMIGARDQLLLDVSHELRSPLTRMKVALELLPAGDKRERMAADVAEMEAMIGELLERERLRDGGALERERLDLVSLLRVAVAEVAERAPGVRVSAAPDALIADGDPTQLRTVLRNLLENAVKYSLPDSRPVEVSAGAEGDRAVVRVRDDGPGIPVADLPRLFEPFFRVDRSRSKRTGGYGLGLSLCRRIVEAHGGSLTVENLPGRGSEFTLLLPLDR
jgi:signal transduction histidine kinase